MFQRQRRRSVSHIDLTRLNTAGDNQLDSVVDQHRANLRRVLGERADIVKSRRSRDCTVFCTEASEIAVGDSVGPRLGPFWEASRETVELPLVNGKHNTFRRQQEVVTFSVAAEAIPVSTRRDLLKFIGLGTVVTVGVYFLYVVVF